MSTGSAEGEEKYYEQELLYSDSDSFLCAFSRTSGSRMRESHGKPERGRDFYQKHSDLFFIADVF